MSSRLIDRVRGAQQRFKAGGTSTDNAEYERIKRTLHSELLETLDFEQVTSTPREELSQRLRDTLTAEVEARALPLNRLERERLVEEILDDILGLGPLEPLLKDPDISDILINGYNNVFVEKRGLLHACRLHCSLPARRHREARAAAAHRRPVQRQPAPDAGHRAHRLRRRPPR